MSSVLLVSPKFFKYEERISAAFEHAGHGVTLVDERPSNRAHMRALFRVAPGLVPYVVNAHYRRVWKTIKEQRFDLVLVIKAELIPEWFLDRVTRRSPLATRVIYTYDSFRHSPRALRLGPRFHLKYTFDRADAEHNDEWLYKPLFWDDKVFGSTGGDRSFDLAFVGTMHSDRYREVRSILDCGKNASTFLYVPARWYFYCRRLVDRRWRDIGFRDVSFKKLALEEVAERFATARAVVDLQKPGQAGLTMRTFEALASGAALVTSNTQVRSEPFYDPRAIFVVEQETFRSEVFAEWLSSCRGLEVSQMAKYALSEWVQDIVDGAESLGDVS